jgi:large repetitive protein
MLLLLLSLPALAFPTDSDWAAIQAGGADLVDVFNDHDRDGIGNPDGIDCVGDNAVAAPALYWYTDGASLWFRIRVDDTPWLVTDSLLQPNAWSFLLDTDGNLDDFEYSLAVAGASPTVYLYRNSTGDTDGSGDDGAAASLDSLEGVWTSDAFQASLAGSTLHTIEDWFVDVEVDLGELPTSVSSGQTIRVAAITGDSSTPNGADADLCGTDDSASLGALTDAWSDEIGVDRDGDGLLDLDEEALGTDFEDADSDDDGLSDGDEVHIWGSDPLRCDTDGDLLVDGLEAGVSAPLDGTDLTAACFEPDGDGGLTTTDPAVADTDGGSVNDGDEDRDGDGVEGSWETDPNDPSDDVDADGDGIADALEDRCGGEDTTDRDGDGIADSDEGLTDGDGDGLPDFCDEDDDDDGVPTVEEGTNDSDGDGDPDYLDPDSDNNGVLDGDEPGADVDSDCDGLTDRVDLDDTDGDCADPDGDGLTNAVERDCGSDPENPDTDGDGVLDGDESCDEDIDCDELPDILDADDADTSACDGAGDTSSWDSGSVPTCVNGLCGGHYTGGSCSTTGGAGAGLLGALAAAGLAARRRRSARLGQAAAVLGAAAAVASTAAHAAEPSVNAQRFRPTFENGTFFSVHDTNVHAPGFGAGLVFNYAAQPLQYRYDDGREPVSLLDSAASFDLGGSFAIGRFGMTVNLPLHLVSGDLMDGGFAPGDLRLGVLASILDRKTAAGGFALYGSLGVPTGDGERFVGSNSPEVSAGVAGSYGSTWVVSANLGMAIGAPAVLGDLSWGSRAQWGLGLRVPVTTAFAVIGELDGESAIANIDEVGGTPMEWRVGGSAQLSPSLQLDAGFGTGITTGIGAPEYRVTAGVKYLPAAAAPVKHGNDRPRTSTARQMRTAAPTRASSPRTSS